MPRLGPLRKEDPAQQGVSSLPLHAQLVACSLQLAVSVGPKGRFASLLVSFIA